MVNKCLQFLEQRHLLYNLHHLWPKGSSQGKMGVILGETKQTEQGFLLMEDTTNICSLILIWVNKITLEKTTDRHHLLPLILQIRKLRICLILSTRYTFSLVAQVKWSSRIFLRSYFMCQVVEELFSGETQLFILGWLAGSFSRLNSSPKVEQNGGWHW